MQIRMCGQPFPSPQPPTPTSPPLPKASEAWQNKTKTLIMKGTWENNRDDPGLFKNCPGGCWLSFDCNKFASSKQRALKYLTYFMYCSLLSLLSLLSYPLSNASTSPVGFTFKMNLESDYLHFSLPSQLPPWSDPLWCFSWVIAIAF